VAFTEDMDRASLPVATNVGKVIGQVDARQLRNRTLAQIEQNNVLADPYQLRLVSKSAGRFRGSPRAAGWPRCHR
jgi:hypothetical protein